MLIKSSLIRYNITLSSSQNSLISQTNYSPKEANNVILEFAKNKKIILNKIITIL